jgi:hypothetical protein
MPRANEIQVGGDHYKSDYQHWDWVNDLCMPYILGCATKYVVRLGKKNPDDAQKAIHCLEKWQEVQGVFYPGDSRATTRFIGANQFSDLQAAVIWDIHDGEYELAILALKKSLASVAG